MRAITCSKPRINIFPLKKPFLPGQYQTKNHSILTVYLIESCLFIYLSHSDQFYLTFQVFKGIKTVKRRNDISVDKNQASK